MSQLSSSSRRLSPCVLKYIAKSFLTPYIGALLGFMALFMLVDSINGDMRDFLEENTKIKQMQERQHSEKGSVSESFQTQSDALQGVNPSATESASAPQASRQQRKPIPWSVILTFLLAKQPQNLTYVIPFACLLAASFMTMILGKNSELTALRAAGLSLCTCCIPVWIAAALSCVAMLAINESWGPACLKKADAIEMEYLKHDKPKKRIAFDFEREHRDWLIDNLDAQGNTTGIIIRQFRADHTTEYLLSAQSAEYDGTWHFHNGFVKHYDQTGLPLLQAPELFDTLEKGFPESPANIQSHSIDKSRMTIRELAAVLCGDLVATRRERNLLKAFLLHRSLFPLAAMIAALFGIALTISTNRMGQMNGFALAVGSLLLFYFVSELGILCVKNGWFTPLGGFAPILGGALPSLVFLAAACTAMWRKA